MYYKQALERLKKISHKLSPQQYKTFRGQILKGDIEGFYKGVKNLFSNHETNNRNVNKKMG